MSTKLEDNQKVEYNDNNSLQYSGEQEPSSKSDHESPEKKNNQLEEAKETSPVVTQKLLSKRKGKVQINEEIVREQVQDLLCKMEEAEIKDQESMQAKKPSFSKIELLPEIQQLLKKEIFAFYFLDAGGLEVLGGYLKQLPDGSWPNSSLRDRVLKLLLYLPVQYEHLENSTVGRIIVKLEKSKEEFEASKEVIRQIRSKWSRIVCGVDIDYSKKLKIISPEKIKPLYQTQKNQPVKIIQNNSEEASSLRRANKKYDFVHAPRSNVSTMGGGRKESEVGRSLFKIKRGL